MAARTARAPHYEIVDGYPLPVRLSGHRALELCNSYAGWGEHPLGDTGDERGDRSDFLRSYDVLAVFARHTGVLDPATVAAVRAEAGNAPGPARRVLGRTREFRAALHALATATGPPPKDALAAVTGELARSRAVARPGYGERLRWHVPADAGLAAPLTAFALAADELLTGTGLATVAACPGPHCGWLFLDPAGRRRWCSMASCGNRAKARRHAAREAASTAASTGASTGASAGGRGGARRSR